MRRFFQRQFYLATCGMGLLTYHLYVFSVGEKPALNGVSKSSQIHFSLGSLAQFEFRSPAREPLGFAKYIDPSAKFLAQLGYLARYQLGDSTDLVVRGITADQELLFVRKDFTFSRAAAVPGTTKHRRILLEVAKELEKKGVSTIFVPVATKLSNYSHAVSDKMLFDSLWWPQPSNLNEISLEQARKVYYGGFDRETMVDTFAIFQSMRNSHIGADPHWTPHSLALVVQQTALRFEKWGWKVSRELPKVSSVGTVRLYCLNEFQLPNWFITRTPRLQQPQTFYDLAPGSGPKNRRVILFGTSNSTWFTGTDFTFAKLLSRALGTEVIEFGVDGEGARGSAMRAKKEGFRFRRGDILVWEFPMQPLITHRDQLPDFLFEVPSRDLATPR